MCEYSKMILILFLILIVVYLLPMYPKPRVYHNFVTPEERRHIIQKSEKNLEPSLVSEERHIDETIRKSETAWLGRGDPVVDAIIKRCLKNTDRPIVNCERLQVLRYKPGGFYEPHQDVIEGDKNPRMYTFILALNDDYEGGEFGFFDRELVIKAPKGGAVLFPSNFMYPHEIMPVTEGTRYSIITWFI